jgi:hypothetical protein
MDGLIIFWSVAIFFAFVAFALMSAKMLYKGFPELREMFRKLRDAKLKG